MKTKTILILILLAGSAAACDSYWMQDRSNYNLNLFTESDFGGSDCALVTNTTFNKIRCCGATANQVGGIITKANLPIVSKAFTVESNFTFIAVSVSHAYFGLVNKADAADAQSVNITSPKMLIGMTIERGSAGVSLYCNGTYKAGVNGPAGYTNNYVAVQRFKRTAGESLIYPEFWNGSAWFTGSDGCDIYDVAGFDNSPLAVMWSFNDDATTKCADLNHLKSVSNYTDYGSFSVTNNNSYTQESCVITNVADYWGGIYPYQYTTDNSGLTGTARLDYGCEYSETYGYYSLIAVETECPGYNLKSDDILFYSKNESSLLALINVGEAVATTSTTTTTTTSTTLPATFTISDISTQPTETGPDGQFQVYMRTEKNGVKYSVDSCTYLLESIDGTGTASSISFAYTIGGNTYGTYHKTEALSDPYWTLKSSLINRVNASATPGEYEILVYCVKGNETQYGYNTIKVKAADATTLTLIGSIPNNIPRYTSQPFIVEYRNSTGNLLSGALCTYTDTAQTVNLKETPQKRYQGYVYYSLKGFISYNITCAVADFQNASIVGTVTVTDQTCHNSVMDGDELGIDCGGSCAPCGGNQTGGGGCGLKYDDCTVDDNCCSGWCGRDANNDKVCLNPSCTDGIKNQDEFKIDCGGPNCGPCPICTYDSGCSSDGSQYCNDSYHCVWQTCATDADCKILRWDIVGVGVVDKPTYCDIDAGLCKFDHSIGSNNTNIQLGMDIVPVTGFTANTSGTLFYTLNCDEENNGFIISTLANTTTYYSFATSGYSPSIGYDQYLRAFNGRADKKTATIPELCAPVNGFGGIPAGNGSVYARILFKTCQGSECISKIIDVITYRHSIKNDLRVNISLDEYTYGVIGRNINLQVRKKPQDAYINVTDTYKALAKFNLTQIAQETISIYYYRITTPYGEVYEQKYGSVWWMPITYNKDDGWGLNFTIKQWHIWILLALVIVGLVYANYRLQANRPRPQF